jgi:hypothetical protein
VKARFENALEVFKKVIAYWVLFNLYSDRINQRMINFRRLFKIILFVGLFFLFVFILLKLLDFISKYVDIVKAETGGSANIYMGFILALIVPFMIYEMITCNLQRVFGHFILILPFTARASRLIGINAYEEPFWIQRISITTILLFLLLIKCSPKDIALRRKEKPFKVFEVLLWSFAILSTISQFVNHSSLHSAFWLSIGGMWQFVALFYVISMIIHSEEDARLILKYVVLSMLLGIIVRIGTSGQIFAFISGGTDRLDGTTAFGPAVSYGGYLAFIIIICTYLIRSSKKVKIAFLWIFAMIFLFFEMINTFTRGATLALCFFVLLALWKSERRFVVKIGVLLLPVFIVFWPLIIKLLTVRPIYLNNNFFTMPGVANRLTLIRLSSPHFFDNMGFGYGIGIGYLYEGVIEGQEVVAHNLILELANSVGGIAALIFAIIYCYAMYRLILLSKAEGGLIITKFLAVALASWLFFANTTSTSILYYYPYEGTMLLYIVLFMSIALPVKKEGSLHNGFP